MIRHLYIVSALLDFTSFPAQISGDFAELLDNGRQFLDNC
jgi:hypothetical protein